MATASNIMPLAHRIEKPTLAATQQPLPSTALQLRILATSDLHANILAWDYHTNNVCPSRGLARTATLITQARGEVENCLLFDNGDFLNGTALGDFVAQNLKDPSRGSDLHPMIVAMNHLRFDAATLGNHEFSHGLPVLTRSLRDAAFPIVASNLHLTALDAPQIAVQSLILTRDMLDDAGNTLPLRIAVLGFLPPQTTVWEHRHLKGKAEIDDIVSTARSLLPCLRANGADLVIALSHSGLGSGLPDPFAENASQALAAVDGIDVVITGHTHTIFPTQDCPDLAGKPAVMPGFFGSHLGVIDLTLTKPSATGEGWRVRAFHAATLPIAHRNADGGYASGLVLDDPFVSATAAKDHAALQAWSDQPMGQTRLSLHSFFALLTQSPALDLVALAQTRYLSQVLANGPYDGLPILSAVAPFKAGGRGGPQNYTAIPAGPLLRRNVGDLYLHPNSLVGLRLSGLAILRWLERSVSLFHQIIPGAQDADLINPDFPSYDFDVIYGLTYAVDVSQPARFDRRGTEVSPRSTRITNPCYRGKPIMPDQMFVLASNSYRCAGGNGFISPQSDQMIVESNQSNQTLVGDFITAGGQIENTSPPLWSIAAMKNTTVVFDCDPRAIAALPDVRHLQLEPVVRLPNGFHRFRLHL